MIQTVPNTAAAQSQAIPIEHLHTRAQIRTRKGFEEHTLKELAASIKQHGILQPLIVTQAEEPGEWYVVAGERRLLAASMAGLTELPCVIRYDAPAELVALQAVENLQREDLEVADVADGLAALARVHGSWRNVAKAIGKSPAWVSKRRALTRLRPIARATMNEGITQDPEILLTLNQIEQLDGMRAAFLAEGLQLGTVSRDQMRAALVELKRGKPKVAESAGGDEDADDDSEGSTATGSAGTVPGLTLKLSAQQALWLRKTLTERADPCEHRTTLVSTLDAWWSNLSKP